MKLNAAGLENEQLRLEPFSEAHVAPLEASGAIDAMWAWMPAIPGISSVEGYSNYVLQLQERGELYGFALFRQCDDAFAGVACYDAISRLHRRLRITTFWHPQEMRGTGVFPASQALLIRRALDWGARRIGWAVPTDAHSAIEAVKRLGAREEGVLRKYSRLAGGGWGDVTILSMLYDEAEMALQRIEIAAQLAADTTRGET